MGDKYNILLLCCHQLKKYLPVTKDAVERMISVGGYMGGDEYVHSVEMHIINWLLNLLLWMQSLFFKS